MRSPVPTTSCQRASTSPRRSAPLRTASSTSSRPRGVGAGGVLPQRRRPSPPARRARPPPSATRAPRLSSAPASVRRTSAARAPRVGGQPVEPRPHGRQGGRRQQPRLQADLRHDEQLGVRRARARRASRAGGRGPRRRPRAGRGRGRRDSAVPRSRAALQQVPRDRVGVAGRGRHEEPGVGRGQQLARQRPVGLDDRVDVGRVEQGEPGRQRGRRRELQGARGRERRIAAATCG